MKMKIFLCLMFGFLYSIPNYAVKPSGAPVEGTEVSKKEIKKALKLEKQQKKIEKKLAKKGKGKAVQGLWNDDNFRLGAYIAIGGLLLRALSIIPLLGGIISLIGTLIFLVGVGIMIWVMVD